MKYNFGVYRTVMMIVSLSVILVALAGCSNASKTSSNTMVYYPTGDQGLAFSWSNLAATGNSSNSIYVGMPFTWMISINNDGYAQVPENSGYYVINGIDPSIWGITTSKGTFPSYDLKGTRYVTSESKNILPGDNDILSIDSNGYSSKIDGNSLNQNVEVNFCYPYNTSAATMMCVANNLYDKNNKICKASGTDPTSSSAAPVKVSSVTQYSYASKTTTSVRMIYTIQKTGSGQVFLPTSTLPHCGLSLAGGMQSSVNIKKNENKVHVKITTPDTTSFDIKCSGVQNTQSGNGYFEGDLYLTGTPVTCTFRQVGTPVATTYQLLTKMVLTYQYKDSILQPITILSSPTG